MTEKGARTFVWITGTLALVSILAAAVVSLRWRNEHDTFRRRLESVCDYPGHPGNPGNPGNPGHPDHPRAEP